ncbi:MAG TPA: HAD-IA family hydrolase [bacterium]|nr:HAD-IA family hydrolase [bacterium]
MNPWQAVFLDFDGVILETTGVKEEGYRRIFADYPAVCGAMTAWLRDNVEQSRFVKFRKLYELLGEELTPAREAELIARYSALTLAAVREAPFVTGAAEFLAGWHGAPLRVISGTPQTELVETIRARGLAGYFAAVYGAPPDKPAWFARLLPELGLDPARCVMVGDAPGDWRAAAGAGLQFIGRVPPGADNPFPATIPVIADLRMLAAELER